MLATWELRAYLGACGAYVDGAAMPGLCCPWGVAGCG